MTIFWVITIICVFFAVGALVLMWVEYLYDRHIEHEIQKKHHDLYDDQHWLDD